MQVVEFKYITSDLFLFVFVSRIFAFARGWKLGGHYNTLLFVFALNRGPEIFNAPSLIIVVVVVVI